MYKVLVERTLPMPRRQVFDLLVQFGGLEKILPDMIERIDLTGSGIGALRSVKLKNGGTVVERLEIAHDERVFAYSITYNDAMPFKDYCAVVTLAHEGGGTRAAWGSNWNPDGASEEEIKTMLNGLYATLLEGLHKLA